MPPSQSDGTRLGGIYFVLGAIVVALGVVLWLVSDDSSSVTEAPPPATSAPATPQAPSTTPAPAAPSTAAPAPATTAPGTTPPAATSN